MLCAFEVSEWKPSLKPLSNSVHFSLKICIQYPIQFFVEVQRFIGSAAEQENDLDQYTLTHLIFINQARRNLNCLRPQPSNFSAALVREMIRPAQWTGE